jgi:hypothetical protein
VVLRVLFEGFQRTLKRIRGVIKKFQKFEKYVNFGDFVYGRCPAVRVGQIE